MTPISVARPFALVTALMLVAAGTLPTALAEEHPDYTERWQAIKEALGQGEVEEARSIFQTTFQGAADTAPAARGAIQAGLSQAAGAQPESLAYIAASQQIDKAHYAIAWANLQAAAASGDVTQAQAWFDLLATKFDGEAELPQAKQAFASVDEASLEQATATLATELDDLITSKVYLEAHEAAELMDGGEQATAVKEAAEARYYYLTVQDQVNATLGPEVEAHLTSELDGLLTGALEGDGDEVQAEATEVLDLVAGFALVTLPAEKADAFATFKDQLGSGDVADARATYEQALAEAGEEYAPAAHARVLDALETAATLDASADAVAYTVQGQIAKKSILDIAQRVGLHELAEGEIHEGLEHLAILSAKFSWTQRESPAATAAGHIAASNQAGDERLDQLRRAIADTFLSKVREEVEEVFINWEDNAVAQEKAIEGVVYFHPVHDDVAQVLGDAPAQEMLEELQALFNATREEDREAAEAAAEEVTKLLDQVEAEGEEVTELDSLLSNLRGKISFVEEEYRGYLEAMGADDQAEADTELGEARAFTQASIQKIRDNEATLREADDQAVDELLATLDEVATLVNETGPLADVTAQVSNALSLLDQLAQSQVEGTVTVQLGPAQAAGDGQIAVPITLQGLSGEGLAFQATLTYDTSVLEAVDVTSSLDVKASQIDAEAGEVRFNGAATGSVQGAVATLTFEVTDATATTTELTLTVGELADGQGNTLGVKSIEGGELDLTSAPDGAAGAGDGPDGQATEEQPAPGPGLLLAGLVLALVAAAVHRKR